MEKSIRIGVSNRHVHLTEEVYYQLFDEPISKKKDLHQIGEFACDQVVKIKTAKNEIANVRVLGPFRDYNQVEISKSDAYFLGINPPVRKSGDLKNSETVTLVTQKGSITLNESCILADRHVHMNPLMAKELGVTDGQIVQIKVKGDKSCLLDAHIKVSENGYFELHLDFDDANACDLKNDDEVLMIL